VRDVRVSEKWAERLREYQIHMRSIGMPTRSRFVEVTAGFVRRFAALQGIMQMYTEPAVFDLALAESVAQAGI
jgi:hypothetical protein